MAVIDDLIKQIQAQGTIGQWSGGYAPDAATKDMARILAGIGITDINQFGKIPKYQTQSVYNGQQVGFDEDGRPFVSVPSGAVDDYGSPEMRREFVDPSQVKEVKVEAGTAYGNKLTGQVVPNTYSERQTGNAWGGTFEGKGNTGYRVDFTPDGKPVFYTTGASSSDAGNWMPIVQLALAATGAGGLLGNALLGAGANQVAASALGGALLGGGASALTGQDILKGALMGGAGGALSGYLNPATGQITATPTEGAIPLTGDEIAKLGGTDLGIDYSLSNGTAMKQLTDMGGAQGLQAGTAANLTDMGGGQGFQFNAGAPVTSVADAVKAIATMNGSVNPANLASMGGGQGLTYQTPTGLVTQDAILNVGGLTGNNSVISAGGIDTASNIGSDIAKRVAAIDTGVDNLKMPVTPTEPTTSKSPLSVSDAIRLAGIGATLAGGAKLASSLGSSGGAYDIVPIPSDWTSPIKPTGTAEFTPLAPIDFGNKEMLRGTQWEKLLSPDYGKAPAMPSTPTNPSNMNFDQLMGILGNTKTSIPTSNVSINDVIAGIQSQYGQAPKGSMG